MKYKVAASILLGLSFTAAGAAPGKWETLFDGKTPHGWRTQTKPAFPTNAWKIEDGCIHSIASAPWVDLSTEGTFRNFELEFEWKLGVGTNSGVKYLVFGLRPNASTGVLDPNVPKALGLELQLMDDATVADAKAGASHGTGALYLFVAPKNVPSLPVNKWHTARIVVNGNHVEHWLQGVKVMETDLTSPELRKAMENEPRPDTPKPHHLDELKENPQKKYPLVLTHHGGDAWYRNIRVRELR